MTKGILGSGNVVQESMATSDPSWQDILDVLTRKASKDGLLRSIKNAKSIEAKVGKVIDNLKIR